MKLKTLAAVIAATLVLAGCNKADQETAGAADGAVADQAAGLTTQEQKISYIFGQNIGRQLSNDKITIDTAVFTEGVSDALAGKESKISEEDTMAVLQAFQEQKMAEQQKQFDEAAGKNKAEGDKFLAENGKKEGVVTLESGLQYKVITEGTGPQPAEGATVEVHYRGTLLDGSEFDSSHKRGVPASFGVDQVIPGWTEALALMKEGSKWELYIPPALAYGPGGAGEMIGPEQTLIFEVELLKANVVEGAEGEEAPAAAEPEATEEAAKE